MIINTKVPLFSEERQFVEAIFLLFFQKIKIQCLIISIKLWPSCKTAYLHFFVENSCKVKGAYKKKLMRI